MQLLLDTRPLLALQPFVRTFAQRNYSLTSTLVEPVLPCVEPILCFLFSEGLSVCFPDGTILHPPRVAIVGPNLCAGIKLSMSNELDLFAVFFQPAGFSDLFGVPISVSLNSYHDVTCLIAGISLLWEQLSEACSFATRVTIVEAYLLSRISHVTPSIDMRAANLILRSRGMLRVERLAEACNLSMRQFERRFIAAVGISPKAFARIARFESALDAKISMPERSWCDIAHTFGYYDQMHMVHDFEQITGLSPGTLMKSLGDARPPALATLKEE